MWASLTKHWFLTSLAICFGLGFFFADRLHPLLQMSTLRNSIVFAVMWTMGVSLRAESIRRSLAKPFPSLLAIAINVVAVPLLSLPWMWLLPESLFGGLFVTAIVPSTLASASVWTRKAGGDDSVTMMTTVVTNLACVIVVPVGIWLVLSQQAQIDVVEQVKKLGWLVVFPLVLAQVMRRMGADGWADRNRQRLSLGGQLGILAMVVFGSVASAASATKTGSEGGGGEEAWISSLVVILAVLVIHCLALYLGILAARAGNCERPSQIAVGIGGSQKTLMVGLQIAIDCGVSVLPMIAYHLSQLVIDTIVADRWKRKSAELEDSRVQDRPQS